MKLKVKKPKLICYDWDNTLVDTQPVTLISMNMLYKKYNLPELSMFDIIRINGYCFSDIFIAQFGKDKSEEIQKEYQILYNNCAENMLQPLFKAKEILKMFHDLGIKQCVISNKPGDIVRYEAKKFNFDQYFEFIIGYTDSGYAKPDPKMFDYVYQKIDFKEKWHHPEKLWFFGDSSADAEFAKNINSKLFFLGDSSIIDNFPLDHLILLNGYSELEEVEFIS